MAAKTGLAISLVQLSSPAGAGVQNPLTTLLSQAIALGFSANEATMAIKTVLGDAATPALIDAWGEAYWLLANLLIYGWLLWRRRRHSTTH